MMQRTKMLWAIGTVVLLGLGWGLVTQNTKVTTITPPPSVATSTPVGATSTQVSSTTSVPLVSPIKRFTFPINPVDQVISWSFTGAYTTPDAIAVANADRAKLRENLGTGKYDDYDLYIGLGNDANLMGDGKGAYEAYNKSVSIHPAKGLAYTNLGYLFDELGDYHTAADAYAKAVAVEPGMLQYHLQRLNFLTARFATDNARLVVAFSDVSKQFGDTAPVLAIEARWLTDQKRYADAITAWERAKLLSLGRDTSAIDSVIAELKTKQ